MGATGATRADVAPKVEEIVSDRLKPGPQPVLTARDKFELRANVEAGVTIKAAAAMAGISVATAMRALADLRKKLGPERRQNASRARAHLQVPKESAPAKKDDGYLYVFGAGEYVKIGFSQLDADARWWQIKANNPLLEPPLYISPAVGTQARELERLAHEALGEHRCSGEWFKCPRELAVSTVKSLVEHALNGPDARRAVQYRSSESI